MSPATALVSIGDDGVLNREISQPLSDVWLDRDLGWLDFNDRVLAEALDERTPLLERAKFLAIFTSNLWKILDICLRDRRQAWVLGPEGNYSQLRPDGTGDGQGTHEALMELARHRSE